MYPEEFYNDSVINAAWFGVKELCDNVSQLTPDQLIEAKQSVKDCQELLKLCELFINERKI